MSTEELTAAQHREQYLIHAHRMQTGVAAMMHVKATMAMPKDLRVGINSAMVEHSALAKLLMDKGVFTELEYMKALHEAMKAEADRFQAELSENYGREITLV